MILTFGALLYNFDWALRLFYSTLISVFTQYRTNTVEICHHNTTFDFATSLLKGRTFEFLQSELLSCSWPSAGQNVRNVSVQRTVQCTYAIRIAFR